MSLLRLNRLFKRYLVLGFLGIRRSPSQHKQWEAGCRILDLTKENARPEFLWCPVSEIGHYPPLSQVGRRPGKLVTRSKPKRRTFREMEPIGLSDMLPITWSVDVELFQKNEMRHVTWGQQDTYFLYENSSGQRIAIPSYELSRFYCGVVPNLIDTVFEAGVNSKGSTEHLFEPDQTRVEERRFIVAPRRSFASISSILQIAVLVTDEEMLWIFQNALHQMKSQLRVADNTAFVVVPAKPAHLTLDGRFIPSPDGSTEVFFANRLVSDHRPRPVDEIEIHYPFAAFPPRPDEQKEPDPEGNPEDRLPDLFGPDTNLGRHKLASMKKIFVSSLANQFSTNMPSWAKTKLEYHYRDASPGLGGELRDRSGMPRRNGDASEATVSQTSSSGTVPQIRHVALSEPRSPEDIEDRERVPSEFVKEFPSTGMSQELVDASAMTKKLRAFLYAGIELLNWQDTPLSPNVAGEREQGSVLVLPEDWGGVAGLNRRRDSRRIMALPLLTNSQLVWAVEIERRAHYEKMSIGIFSSQKSGADAWDLLNNVIFNMCRRSVTRKASDEWGLWPEADYTDVRLTKLIHSPRRSDPGTLAADLLLKALQLAGASLSP